jgi:hypothetical protein
MIQDKNGCCSIQQEQKWTWSIGGNVFDEFSAWAFKFSNVAVASTIESSGKYDPTNSSYGALFMTLFDSSEKYIPCCNELEFWSASDVRDDEMFVWQCWLDLFQL